MHSFLLILLDCRCVTSELYYIYNNKKKKAAAANNLYNVKLAQQV